MLPAGARLRRSEDFRVTMRRGAKAGGRTAVVYVVKTGGASSMAGFAVSRAVGGAVVRNLVKRRLRAVMADALATIPEGSHVVVRALPAAADASFAQLRTDVLGALGRAEVKANS
ncbi:ribonuclease P protein component [Demequina lutea]|uniref:Ribonuclease P protein component n=1 Tax=Demequina lutea TaxID=431489 RepID=A0A7Y9Z734_9MICO|nr:ribonuclease P protein component [Demequina lutea]NYI39949.1 ribonuclease P protein component [Demequina lutea]